MGRTVEKEAQGMYDITKTRMLLTTAMFAAVAAVFAGGGNARIPDEDGSGFEGHLSIAGVVGAQAPSWRGKGGKGEETGGYRGQVSLGIGVDAAQGPSWQGRGGKGEE